MLAKYKLKMLAAGKVEWSANPSYGAVRLKLRPQWHNLRTTSRKLMMMIRMMMMRRMMIMRMIRMIMMRMMVNNIRN